MARTHLVMVPGFGGFDALGQMHYYTRVTTQFEEWFRRRGASGIELHYFDNLPTASVATRTRDLETFLEKRVRRHSIQGNDKLVLIGHSTGGLDIRHVLTRLRSDIRERVSRVVFMSAPHYGTNIADFVHDNRTSIGVLLWGLRHAPWVAGKLISFIKLTGICDDSELVTQAIDDLRRELVPPDDGYLAAEARRAQGELVSWRDQTSHDFLAIHDLRARARPADPLKDVDCLSFATIAPSPLSMPLGHDPCIRRFDDAWSLTRDMDARRAETDSIFRLAYAACSAGPFDRRVSDVEWLPGFGPSSIGEAQRFLGAQATRTDRGDLEPWHNDGIVNTASMVCEQGKTWLVGGDHADIIGHYARNDALPVAPADPTEPSSHARLYDAYNLLRSDARFQPACFNAIWEAVFDFAADVAASASVRASA